MALHARPVGRTAEAPVPATATTADPTSPPATATPGAGVPRGLVAVMAVATGGVAANNYYAQPLLGDMARDLGVTIGAVGLVAGATQVGYMLGLAFLAPLGDRYDRRRLILLQFVGLVAALVVAALAPTLPVLLAASLVAGTMTSIVQQLVPFAAQLAPAATRGRVVGTVMTGLTVGLLLARTISGTIGQHFGWHAVYWFAAAVAVALAALLARRLPASRPTTDLSYARILGSLVTLARTQPVLREAAVVGALWFACFNIFWATLAVHLAGAPFHYGAQIAGLFGLVGGVGATATRVSGRLADRLGARPIIGVTLGVILAAFALLFVAGDTLGGVVGGVILLDLGVFAGQVANQARIFALRPEARSRINSVYVVCYYGGGALGSSAGAWAFATLGWHGVCALALGLGGLAYLIHLRGGRQRTNAG